LFAYPGFHAIIFHYIAMFFYNIRLRALGRIIANISRILTGADIHPQAKIGKFLFMDYPFGVVIGQTAIVEDNVTLYEGVVLGGAGPQKDKRHPTVKEGAVIGAGAKILGNVTIGRYARVGVNSVVVQDVPDYAIVMGIPAKIIQKSSNPDMGSAAYGLPERIDIDPLAASLMDIHQDIQRIKADLQSLKDNKHHK
jgi:serine O-acetyltransferase